MYSRQEASQIRQEFWTVFGQYMQPVLSAEGMRINWVNYKTGEQHITFRMAVDNKHAAIGISITHADKDIQELYYEQFAELKKILHATLGEEWMWQKLTKDEYGKTVSRIYTTIDNISIFRKEDWPELISFFKPRIIALDEFWSNVKPAFEAFR